MSALNGMVSSFSMALTSIADRLHQVGAISLTPGFAARG